MCSLTGPALSAYASEDPFSCGSVIWADALNLLRAFALNWYILYTVQYLCKGRATALIRLRGCAGWSGSSVSAYSSKTNCPVARLFTVWIFLIELSTSRLSFNFTYINLFHKVWYFGGKNIVTWKIVDSEFNQVCSWTMRNSALFALASYPLNSIFTYTHNCFSDSKIPENTICTTIMVGEAFHNYHTRLHHPLRWRWYALNKRDHSEARITSVN